MSLLVPRPLQQTGFLVSLTIRTSACVLSGVCVTSMTRSLRRRQAVLRTRRHFLYRVKGQIGARLLPAAGVAWRCAHWLRACSWSERLCERLLVAVLGGVGSPGFPRPGLPWVPFPVSFLSPSPPRMPGGTTLGLGCYCVGCLRKTPPCFLPRSCAGVERGLALTASCPRWERVQRAASMGLFSGRTACFPAPGIVCHSNPASPRKPHCGPHAAHPSQSWGRVAGRAVVCAAAPGMDADRGGGLGGSAEALRAPGRVACAVTVPTASAPPPGSAPSQAGARALCSDCFCFSAGERSGFFGLFSAIFEV